MNGKKLNKKKVLTVLVLIGLVALGIICFPRLPEESDFYATADFEHSRKYTEDTVFTIKQKGTFINNSGIDYYITDVALIVGPVSSRMVTKVDCPRYIWTGDGSKLEIAFTVEINVGKSQKDSFDGKEVEIIGAQFTMSDGTIVNVYMYEPFVFWSTGPTPLRPTVPYEYVRK